MTGQLLLFALVGVVFTAIIAAAVAIHMLEAIHVREEAHRLAVTPTATVAAPEPEPNRVWCVLCGDVIDTEERAASFIRSECGVTSRAHLDHDKDAARAFREMTLEYDNWKQGRVE